MVLLSESEGTQQADITSLLRRWQAGDSNAYDQVISWAYQRMLAIAAGFVALSFQAALAQDRALGVEVAAIGDHVAKPIIFDLRDVDGGIPCGKQRGGAD